MQSPESRCVGVVLDEHTVVSRWAAIPRLRGPNPLVVHTAHTADIAWSVEYGPSRVIDKDSLGELGAVGYWNSTPRNRGTGIELVVKEPSNELVEARLTQVHCQLMDVARYFAN
jgi:hypothetical protein